MYILDHDVCYERYNSMKVKILYQVSFLVYMTLLKKPTVDGVTILYKVSCLETCPYTLLWGTSNGLKPTNGF